MNGAQGMQVARAAAPHAGCVAARVSVLASAASRMRGLMRRECAGQGAYVVLAPCRDIHTYGMTCAIDVAFVDAAGMVVAAYRNVAPRKRLRHGQACLVAERFASEKPWFHQGDSLFVMPGSAQGSAFADVSAPLAGKGTASGSSLESRACARSTSKRTYRMQPTKRRRA